MRITKYVVIAASIVALLAAIAWFLRDNLIQRISNPLLKEYGITVTDVSLDALASDDASISYLELTHDKGTTIAIEDLTLPFRKTTTGSKTYVARKVSIITATRTDGEVFDLAELIGQFLSVPDKLDESVLLVTEFSLPPYPTIHDVRWDIVDGEQRLRGTVDSVAMSATITRKDAVKHAVLFSVLPGSTSEDGHFVKADMLQGDQNISLAGTSSIELPLWGPIARLAGVVPPEVELAYGTATLQLNVEIPNDATQIPTVDANLAPTSPLQVTYSSTSDDTAAIFVDSASNVVLAATFPEIDWSLQLAEAALSVTYGEWKEIPVFLSRLSCESGPVCTLGTRISTGATELPVGNVIQMEFASNETVTFPETGVRIEVRPGAALRINGLRNAETNVDHILAQLVSGATLLLMDSGWQLSADSVDARIEAMSLSDDVSVSIPLFLENILASELDGELALKSGVYAPSSQGSFVERRIALPGIKGDVSSQGSNLAANLTTVGLHQNGTIKARHNLDTRAGHMNVGEAAISFGAKSLSSRVSPWPGDRDLVSGVLSFELRANWAQKKSSLEFDGQASLAAAGLAGFYGDTAFTGLSTRLKTSYQDGFGFVAEPSTITVALVETGLPVENLSADYTLDPNALSVDVENLQMTAFGGIIRADPFSFHTDTTSNTLTLKAESIDLRELLSLQEFETIDVSGSIAAVLPLMIEDDTVTIVNGTLTGEPSGGVIRYRPVSLPDDSDVSSIAFATRVLSNFKFEKLSSDVNLTKDGDLNLQLRLTGRNPDLDEKRPVVLNLGVENNIPQMLRSLRAARAVEEILEKRLGK
jgi:hypothetical protein